MYRPTILRVAAAAATSLALIACGTTDHHDENSTGTSAAGSDLAADAGSTEVDGPSPRLVLADANSGRIDVVDLTTEEMLDTLDLGHPTVLTGINDRYIYAVSSSENTVHVLDPGSWTIDHGDHSHSYTKPPAEIGRLEGRAPTAVVAGDRKVATFWGGQGSAGITTFDTLSDGGAEPALSITTEASPHGVVIPVDDHFVVSRPDAVELRTDSDDFVKEFDAACPRMQGEAVFDKQAVTACDDGLFVASTNGETWESVKVPYPAEITADTRPSAFRGHDSVPVIAAVAGPAATNDGVLVFDSTTQQWTHIITPERALATHLSWDGEAAFAVLADGSFRVYDIATGTETASAPVLAEPFDPSDTSGPTPQIMVAGKRAYVTDPTGERVQEIDYRDDARIARTLDIDFTVGSASVVGE